MFIQLANGFVDEQHTHTAAQLRFGDTGSLADIAAVKMGDKP